MLQVLKNRMMQGYRTSKYPKEEINLYKRFRGLPQVDPKCDPTIVQRCAEACPQDAINTDSCKIDLGRCTFCGLCQTLSEGKFVTFSQNFELGAVNRDDLFTSGSLPKLAEHSKKHFKKLFGRK